MGAVEIQIEELLLDAENPRFVRGSSQRDILQKVLDDQQEKLYTLAESIVDDGMNPMDRLLVIRADKGADRFIALEGNRRVAALKILANPGVLTNLELKESLKKRFEKLAERFDRDGVEPIAGFEVPSREIGTSWILLRHTGENGGRGVVSWSGIAALRFRGSHPALQALDFVRANGALTVEQKNLLESNSYPITTLDRLLSSREVRRRIGIDVKKSKLVSNLPPDEFMKPLRRIVLDLAQKHIKVSKLKDTGQQIEYIDSFGSEYKPDLSKKGKLCEIDAIPKSAFRAQAQYPKRHKADPSERKTVVPRGIRLNVQDNRVASIFKELRTLKLEDGPNAIAVLLRVFLELSVDYYMRSYPELTTRVKDPKSGKESDKKLARKVQEVVDHLVSQKGAERKDFNGITRALTDRRNPLHIDLLHGYVHNLFVIPKRHDLIGAWDEAQPFFESIWQ